MKITLGVGTIKTFGIATVALAFAVCLAIGEETRAPRDAEAECSWQPRIVKLALEFPEVRVPEGWTERRKTARPMFDEWVGEKQIKHSEKLYY